MNVLKDPLPLVSCLVFFQGNVSGLPGAEAPTVSGPSASPLAVAPATSKEILSLLEALPSQQTLWRYIKLIKSPESPTQAEEVVAAKAALSKTREIIPQVRQLLKTGPSVFSYPGLLAHGDITFQIIKEGPPSSRADPTEYGYRLYMGIPKEEFRHPYDIEVLFDSQGISVDFSAHNKKQTKVEAR